MLVLHTEHVEYRKRIQVDGAGVSHHGCKCLLNRRPANTMVMCVRSIVATYSGVKSICSFYHHHDTVYLLVAGYEQFQIIFGSCMQVLAERSEGSVFCPRSGSRI